MCAGHVADSIRIAGLITEIESVVGECERRVSSIEKMVPDAKAKGKQVITPMQTVDLQLHAPSSLFSLP